MDQQQALATANSLASGRAKWEHDKVTVSLIAMRTLGGWKGYEVMSFGADAEDGDQERFSNYSDALAYAESLALKYGISEYRLQ